MNEITVVGNVTADPVLRKSANGRGVVRFDVAINRRRTGAKPTAPTAPSPRSRR
jgi:single-stranded DNA-binding protein